MNTYTAVYIQRPEWIVAFVEEIPGVNTQGKTMKEARANLKEALQMILQVRKSQTDEMKSNLISKEPIAI
jgi:predicted RNase H-like HicB family nuclease